MVIKIETVKAVVKKQNILAKKINISIFSNCWYYYMTHGVI